MRAYPVLIDVHPEVMDWWVHGREEAWLPPGADDVRRVMATVAVMLVEMRGLRGTRCEEQGNARRHG